MSHETLLGAELVLNVPESLLPNDKSRLPELSQKTLDELQSAGWSRVGLMVAFIDSTGNILVLEHNASDKNAHGALGPLGETSQQSGPIIEQPIETLYRAIKEELGVEDPVGLGLWMYDRDGWVINQWPRGANYPGDSACAISFPVFIPDEAKERLLAMPHGTEEVNCLSFEEPRTILARPDEDLRPGVKNWMNQLANSGLLSIPDGEMPTSVIDFSMIYEASRHDIKLCN